MFKQNIFRVSMNESTSHNLNVEQNMNIMIEQLITNNNAWCGLFQQSANENAGLIKNYK